MYILLSRTRAALLTGLALFAVAGCATQNTSKANITSVAPTTTSRQPSNEATVGVHADHLLGVPLSLHSDSNEIMAAVLKQVAKKVQYPSSAIAQGIHGSEMLRFVVDRSGKIIRSDISISSNSTMLDAEGTDVAHRIQKFHIKIPDSKYPGTQHFILQVPLNFILDTHPAAANQTATRTPTKGEFPKMTGPLSVAWSTQLHDAIYRDWVLPTNKSWKAVVHLTLGINAEILSAQIYKASGDPIIDKQILHAAHTSRPLPISENKIDLKDEIFLCLSQPESECTPPESNQFKAQTIIIMAHAI